MVKACEIAQVSFEAPDLVVMEDFLTDFGLSLAARTPDAVYMRGTGSQCHLHATHRGERARFVGASLEVCRRDDLDELAALPGSSPVEACDEPGGGWRVRMTMPDGFELRGVWGRDRAPDLPPRLVPPTNTAEAKPRINRSVRVVPGPSPVMRLGHFVLKVTDHDASVAWLQRRFGLLVSDRLVRSTGPGRLTCGTFLRFDRGSVPVDHHCILILQADAGPAAHHCAFEVPDLDALMCGHDHLRSRGWAPDCGVGRHLVGSQIFDYWHDPCGFRVERYTDGDVLDATVLPADYDNALTNTTQWGMEPPRSFFR